MILRWGGEEKLDRFLAGLWTTPFDEVADGVDDYDVRFLSMCLPKRVGHLIDSTGNIRSTYTKGDGLGSIRERVLSITLSVHLLPAFTMKLFTPIIRGVTDDESSRTKATTLRLLPHGQSMLPYIRKGTRLLPPLTSCFVPPSRLYGFCVLPGPIARYAPSISGYCKQKKKVPCILSCFESFRV